MKKLSTLLFVVLINTQINAQCWQTIITNGSSQNFAIKTDGTLWAWGHNNLGQIGDGTYGPGNNKANLTQIELSTNWKSIAVGGSHTVALKNDSSLWAWGYNIYGELGNGTFDYGTENYIPTQIVTANDWKYIAAGAYHTLAIKNDGSLWAWGLNNFGQLGDGTSGIGNDKNIPTKIGSDTWQFIIAGTYHSIAIKTDGTLWAWGYNMEGQLGDGTLISKNIPTQIGIATNWLSVSTSNNHNAAIKADGTLWTWGQHDWGKLGDGTYINPTNPVPPTQIGTDTNWKSVSAGGEHTVAIKTDGTLWAWGYNSDGEYGNGKYGFNYFTPTQIGSATNWESAIAGYAHTLFIKTDGTLWATGANSLGQLGDGTFNRRNTPILINCSGLGVEKLTSKNSHFSLYPNPAKDLLNIQNKTNKSIEKIIITDCSGKKILEKKGFTKQVNIENLQQGIYILQVLLEGNNYQEKFIKE